ncbi:22339_t:CDS:1, partial [Dentiscutata erythropus]
MPDQETQTQDTDPICDHEEEINTRVKKELDSLSRQLLEFNEKTFDPFMQEITKQIEERINANNKLRSEINQQKLKLQKAEKLLASLKSQ